MQSRRFFLLTIALAAGAAVVLFISAGDSVPAPSAGPPATHAAGSGAQNFPDARKADAERGADAVAPAVPPAPGMAAPLAGVDPFAPAFSNAELLRTERRMFQAQTWEVDLGKALDLRPGERLERRSGLFRLAGGGKLVRLDRVYRLGGARPAAVKAATQTAQSPAGPAVAVAGATGPLDAGGGELVWANAMVADHLMVQVESGVTRERLAASLPALAHVGKQVTDSGLYLVEVPADGDRSVERAVLALNQIKGVVKFAEPDFVLTSADTAANDPLFTANATDLTKQWHLAKIMAPRVWSVLTGPPFPPAHPQYQSRLDQTVVAVVDTGIDYTHPDLAPNMWINPGETGGGKETNGLDDDANGKVDDWRGYDFIDNDNNPMDDVGHGTHVAGIIGAVGNNATGGSGVCWNVKLLNLRIIKAQGTGTYGTYSAAIAALDYIRVLNTTGRRVAVANHSWGGNGYSLAMLNAINNPVSTNDPLPVGLSSSFSQEVNTFTMTGSASEIGKIKVGMGVSGAGIRLDTLVTIVSGSTITLSDFTSSAGSNVSLSFFNPTRGKPYGVVHVAAAGNSRFNADRIPTYPACLPSGFMICVGAADSGDNVSLWGAAGSNFGRLNVDLFAPGTSIWSTKWKAPGDAAYGYESRNGTSMAAPQVSAALALARMWQPKLSELQARQIVIDQVDVIPALQGKCFSSGRLNIAKTIDRLYQPILVSSGGGTGGTGLITEALAGAVALSGRLAVATTGYSSHALAIVGDRVWSWGSNGWGELGDATIGFDAERSAPAEIAGLNDVRMLAAGDNFSMALKADGTVWVWGSNVHGQHGKGTKDNFFHPTPQKVSGLSEITWISTAALERPYCLAVRADGKVFAWGDNSLGQLGDGTTTEHLTPQMVPGLSDIVQVDAGPDHALALTKNGEVYAWGSRFGQAGWQIYGRADTYGNFGWNSIGDGPDAPSLADSKSPVLVPNLGGIVQVEATMEYSLAVDQTGAVWEWGHFPQGYFQNLVANIGSHTPVLKQGLNEVVAISSGVFHSFAQTSNGEVFSWGLGSFGSLGNGREDDLLAPQSVVVTPGDAIVSVAAGQFQSLAVTVEGKLLAWGLNHRGQIGTGRSAGKGYPSRVRFADSLADVVTDGTTQFGLSTSGRLYVWGFVGDSNAAGFKVYQTPKLLPSPVDIVDIDIGLGNMFAVSSTGSLYFVDTNDPNLGWAELPVYDNNPASGLIRKQIKGVATTHFYYDPLAEPTENNIHALFITTDGKVKGFGGNAHGQLGNNSTTNMWWPLQVTATAEGLSSVKQVAAGVGHSMALKEDGTVWTWGRNNRGQLGNGTLNGRSTPGQVQGLSGIVRISAGDNFSAAIKSDGTVYAWGGTNGVTFPELSIIDRLSPVMINGLGAVEDVVPGLTAMFVQRVDGTALAWSADFFSDYGDRVLARDPASLIARSTPAGVVGLSGIRHLAQEYQGLAFAVKSDGSLWSWGGGTALDVLGDGDSWVNLPTYVVGFGGASYTLSTLGTSDTTDSWMFQNFSISELLDDSVVSDAATPAEDGIPNLVKYALGLNPKQRYGGASLPTPRVDLIGAAAQSTGMEGGIGLFSAPTVDLTSGRRYLAFTVLRNGIHLDINYIVEVSADLQNWMSGNPFTITVLDTAETLEVYDATALEDAPKRFMRLRIQRK